MKITVRFYSISKDLAARNEMEVIVENNTTLETALEAVFKQIPALKKIHASTMYAIGVDYATPSSRLHEGDIISILPPMQGG